MKKQTLTKLLLPIALLSSLPMQSMFLPGMMAGKAIAANYRHQRLVAEQVQCAICLTNVADETYEWLDCGHTFCSSCLGNWIVQSRTCPNCRRAIPQGTATGAAEREALYQKLRPVIFGMITVGCALLLKIGYDFITESTA